MLLNPQGTAITVKDISLKSPAFKCTIINKEIEITMTGIFWGLLGAIFIGVSDGIGRLTTQKASLKILVFFIMGMSTLVMTAWLIISWDWPRWHLYSWATSIMSGLLNVLALLFLFKALARGPVSVASPAASSFSVILVLLNVLSGQPYNFIQLFAVLIVFFGIVMLTQNATSLVSSKGYSSAWLRTTAFLGLCTGITVAFRFFLAQEAVDFLGPLHSLYLNRLSALIFIILLLLTQSNKGGGNIWPEGATFKLVLVQSVLEMLSLGAFLIGSADGNRVGAAIGYSAFAVVTTLTAWVWLGEKVALKRIFWIVIVVGAIMVSIIFGPQPSEIIISSTTSRFSLSSTV